MGEAKTIEFMDNNGDNHSVSLLSCPFCGGEPEITSIGNYHTKKRKIEIKCSNKWKCGNKGFVVGAIIHDFSFCVENATKRWNARINSEAGGDDNPRS